MNINYTPITAQKLVNHYNKVQDVREITRLLLDDYEAMCNVVVAMDERIDVDVQYIYMKIYQEFATIVGVREDSLYLVWMYCDAYQTMRLTLIRKKMLNEERENYYEYLLADEHQLIGEIPEDCIPTWQEIMDACVLWAFTEMDMEYPDIVQRREQSYGHIDYAHANARIMLMFILMATVNCAFAHRINKVFEIRDYVFSKVASSANDNDIIDDELGDQPAEIFAAHFEKMICQRNPMAIIALRAMKEDTDYSLGGIIVVDGEFNEDDLSGMRDEAPESGIDSGSGRTSRLH